MNKKLMSIAGVVLVLLAVVLFVVQHWNFYNVYGAGENKWYFYGLVGVVGVVGLLLAAWTFMKGE